MTLYLAHHLFCPKNSKNRTNLQPKINSIHHLHLYNIGYLPVKKNLSAKLQVFLTGLCETPIQQYCHPRESRNGYHSNPFSALAHLRAQSDPLIGPICPNKQLLLFPLQPVLGQDGKILEIDYVITIRRRRVNIS